jgi:hypothetical protein
MTPGEFKKSNTLPRKALDQVGHSKN